MTRTIFAALGLLFTALIVFSATFLGRLSYELRDQGPAYEKRAVEITRTLSRTWSVQDIQSQYAVAVADRHCGRAMQRSFNGLKALGQLRYVEDLTHRTRWTNESLTALKSPAAAAEMLAELLNKTVRVSFVAKFANGSGDVTMEFKSEGGRMRLWNLQIDSRDVLPRVPSAPHAPYAPRAAPAIKRA